MDKTQAPKVDDPPKEQQDAPQKPSFLGGALGSFWQTPGKDSQTEKPPLSNVPLLYKIPPKWRLALIIFLVMLVIVCIFLSAFLSVVLSRENRPRSDASFTPILPPSYPLAVRNPYLSAWLPGKDAASLPYAKAKFWRDQELGWSVMARVGDDVYSLFGIPSPQSSVKAATVTSGEYTSTRSSFNLTAGDAKFTLDFLSPVFPGSDDASLVQQSLPLSFLTVTAEPSGSDSPKVQVYSDIDSSWLGSPDGSIPDFTLGQPKSGKTYAWTWERTGSDRYYKEKNNMAQWGQVYYSTSAKDDISLTMGFGKQSDVRKQFIANQELNSTSTTFPAWDSDGAPVSAFAHDLGTVSNDTSVTFGIGFTRDLAVKFYSTDYTPYYKTQYPNSSDTITAVADAFDSLAATQKSCAELDAKVYDDSLEIGGANYSHITTLSLRQTFGAIDVTVPLESLDKGNTTAWVKEISSNGDIQTLDIIMPMSPLFYWLTPEYLRFFIRPIAQYLEKSRINVQNDQAGWPYKYAVHDLGDRSYQGGGYPRAVGHDNGKSESMPLESTGNLLILAYMYQNATGNSSFSTTYSTLFDGYANYLQTHGLKPEKQLATNDGAGPLANQTNLAIKAAVALNAYGHMYSNESAITAARDMAASISTPELGLSTSTDSANGTETQHFLLSYQDEQSWGLMFNLYPDVLLNLTTFPATTIAAQNEFYRQRRTQGNLAQRADADLSSIIGLPIDSRGDYGSTNWMMFAGATDPEGAKGDTGRMFVQDVWSYVANGRNEVPFCDRPFVEGWRAGKASPAGSSFRARPVVGGHFAFLARGK